MELQQTGIDAGLLAYEVTCRTRVSAAKAVACDRIAVANFSQIMSALENTGWEARTLSVVQTALKNAGLTSTNFAVLGSIGGADIMALCFIVLMQAAKSAQEDLKAIMDAVKDINEKKAKLRGLLQKIQEKSTTSPYIPWPPTVYIAA